jgi:hypothetical protein
MDFVMTIKKTDLRILITSLVAGFLWAFSFSIRIGLLFIVPMWMKAFVIPTFGANFSLLAWILIHQVVKRFSPKRTLILTLTGSAILVLLSFATVPYRHQPFRTTHRLEIHSDEEDVRIISILSPDDNIIPRSEFETSDSVTPWSKNGFLLPSGENLSYQREQTGGLKIILTEDAGALTITWDTTTQTVLAEVFRHKSIQRMGTWQLSYAPSNSQFHIHLPGHTWGKPTLFWAVIGVVMPIADFVLLTSIIAGLALLVIFLLQKEKPIPFKMALPKAWLDSLLCIGMALILFNTGFPKFLPWWMLLFLIPAVVVLFIFQIRFIHQNYMIEIPGLKDINRLLQKTTHLIAKINHSSWTFWVVILLIAAAGCLIQLKITQPGMGISGDSVHYLQGAQNLAAGNGYVRQIKAADPVAITGFPPVYPFFISLGLHFGAGAEASARYLNTLLLGLTLVLIGWLIFRETRSSLAAALGASFVLMSPPILEIYAWVMSEPLFMVFLLLLIFLWLRYIKKPTLLMALGLGLISGIAILTRLVGIAFLGALCLATVIFQKGKPGKRWLNAVLMGVIGLLPTILFFLRNSIMGESISESRGFTLAPFKTTYWEILGKEAAGWFKWQGFFNQPHQIFNALFVSLGAILVGFILWQSLSAKRKGLKKPGQLTYLILIFMGAYLLMIIANVIFMTPIQTDYGLRRYMLPVFLVFILFTTILLVRGIWHRDWLSLKVLIVFTIAVLGLRYVQDAQKIVTQTPPGFREYTDKRLDCEAEINVFEKLPEDHNIYSNNCEYFFFISGRQCLFLSMDVEDYQPGGEIYEDVMQGDWIAYITSSGYEPPGINALLNDLDLVDSGCYLDFYKWPTDPSN